MRQAAITRTGVTARWIRGYAPDRNPLRRTTDLAEAIIIGVLLLAFLAAAPLAAILASTWANGSRPVADETRYHVPAVLLASAPRPIVYGFGGQTDIFARARWATPAGTVRTGEIQVLPGEKAGRTVMIWIDASGRPSSPPARGGQDRPLLWLTAVLTVGALLLCTGKLARWMLDRRRMDAWDADWRATEPLWSSRR